MHSAVADPRPRTPEEAQAYLRQPIRRPICRWLASRTICPHPRPHSVSQSTGEGSSIGLRVWARPDEQGYQGHAPWLGRSRRGPKRRRITGGGAPNPGRHVHVALSTDIVSRLLRFRVLAPCPRARPRSGRDVAATGFHRLAGWLDAPCAALWQRRKSRAPYGRPSRGRHRIRGARDVFSATTLPTCDA